MRKKSKLENESLDSQVRYCKKCQKELMPQYKYNECEFCRTQNAERTKKGIAFVGSIITAVVVGVIGGRRK